MRRSGRLFRALMLLGAVGACTSTERSEQGPAEAGVTRRLTAQCEVRPPGSGVLAPQLQWAWTGSEVMPEHVQVMMTPVVVDVNADGVPDIVFSTFAGTDYSANGVLRAISGEDGHALWTATDVAARVKPSASLAAGDIDGGGRVEICGIPQDGRGILCVEHDGSFKFRSALDAYDYNEWGGPSLADLDGDGTVEILDGNRVYSHTGALKWVGSDGMGGAQYTGPVSFAADIDQDGEQELVNDRALYRSDGTLRCANTEIPHGFASVGNFDADPAGEIVVAGHGKVSLMDDDCSLRWSIDVPGGGHGGPPNLADVDGDGELEIGLAGEWAYSVLEADGTLKWSSPIQDQSSGRTGSTTFDFEDDGTLEIVFADETRLRIYDGATGAVRWETPHSSGTTHENPVIADVDADGSAELVVVSNDHAYPGTHGIRVFHEPQQGWPGTRRTWNQHAWSVTNLRADGTVPVRPPAPWLQPRLNTFRSNVANDLGGAPNPFAATDLVVSDVTSACAEAGAVRLDARVRNEGSRPAAPGVKVAFYKLDPVAGSSLLGVATLDEALTPGEDFSASVRAPAFSGGVMLRAVVDDDGTGMGQESECREDNNVATTAAGHACQEEPVHNLPPVALCRDVTVTANASCRGTASVDKGSHDPDHGPAPLLITESPSASFGPGRHPVTLTASDGEANASCEGSVTVVDTTPPTIACPLSVDVKIGSGLGIAVRYAVSSQDACGPAPITCSHPSGALFLLGLTQVTCTARDASGNTASCRFGIRVSLDLSLPL